VFDLRTTCALALAGLFVLCGGAGPASGKSSLQEQAPAIPASGTPPYLIGAGDNIQVWVWKNPDLSTEVPVRPDGKVTLPLIDDVQAQGKTTTELALEVRERLSRYVQEPIVSVLVKSFAPLGNDSAIHVIGAAAVPKTIPYRAGITALDVVTEAGGLNIYANGNGAQLIRKEKDGFRSYPLRLKRLINAGDLTANVILMPGDVIRIPERWF